VSTFPQPYGDEMIGIANATDLKIGDIVLFNIFYEIFPGCTSIVSQDQSGNILHARNLDFGLLLGWDFADDSWIISDLLRTVTININFTRNGQLEYITTGFAGFIGVFTGIKPVCVFFPF
jgi:acid ceramidase